MSFLDTLLKRLVVETRDEKALVFSNFTSQLDLLEALCALRGYAFDRLDGDTAVYEREILMKKFNHPSSRVRVLLLSTAAGGVGITLTGANHVVIYDAHFNPQMDRQAADRAHRLGQTRPVTVYRLCIRGTIEERILQRAAIRIAASELITAGGDSLCDMTSLEDCGLGRLLEEEQRLVQLDDQDDEKVIAFLRSCEIDDPRRNAIADSETCPSTTPCMESGLIGCCFACGEEGRIVRCRVCFKPYHVNCCTWETTAGKLNWRCSRHRCSECHAKPSSDEAIFCCISCPRSSCFDCLDKEWFLDMTDSPDGILFPRISNEYAGIRNDGVCARRNVFFVTCKRCAAGARNYPSTSASSAASSSELEEDEDAKY